MAVCDCVDGCTQSVDGCCWVYGWLLCPHLKEGVWPHNLCRHVCRRRPRCAGTWLAGSSVCMRMCLAGP
eukprot:352531-Chlamydomonas_euryale.AAC.2